MLWPHHLFSASHVIVRLKGEWFPFFKHDFHWHICYFLSVLFIFYPLVSNNGSEIKILKLVFKSLWLRDLGPFKTTVWCHSLLLVISLWDNGGIFLSVTVICLLYTFTNFLWMVGLFSISFLWSITFKVNFL